MILGLIWLFSSAIFDVLTEYALLFDNLWKYIYKNINQISFDSPKIKIKIIQNVVHISDME